MTDQKIVDLQNQHLKGVTLTLIYSIIASTVVITAAVLTTLFTLKSEMQTDRSNAKIRQTEVDAKFDRIELTQTQTFSQIEYRLERVENKKNL